MSSGSFVTVVLTHCELKGSGTPVMAAELTWAKQQTEITPLSLRGTKGNLQVDLTLAHLQMTL